MPTPTLTALARNGQFTCPGCGEKKTFGTLMKPGQSITITCHGVNVRVTEEAVPKPKRPSPLKAIRKFCFSCAWRPGKNKKQGVADCTSTACPLWPFRFGKCPEKLVAQGKAHLVVTKETLERLDREAKTWADQLLSKATGQMDAALEFDHSIRQMKDLVDDVAQKARAMVHTQRRSSSTSAANSKEDGQ